MRDWGPTLRRDTDRTSPLRRRRSRQVQIERGPRTIEPSLADTVAEGQVQTFVVRVWMEEAETPEGAGLWRGRVIHVLSQARHDFQRLDEVPAFVAIFLRNSECI